MWGPVTVVQTAVLCLQSKASLCSMQTDWRKPWEEHGLTMAVTVGRHKVSKQALELQNLRDGAGVGTGTLNTQERADTATEGQL